MAGDEAGAGLGGQRWTGSRLNAVSQSTPPAAASAAGVGVTREVVAGWRDPQPEGALG